MSVSQQQSGRGVPCLRCRGMCTGFEPHSWRKVCKSCKCSQEDHSLSSDAEDDRKIGRLLSDSKYSTLTARVKGGDGVRIYKRNRMIITNPIVSRKDPTFDTITYEWAPPGLTQKLAMQYMELIPKDMQPVAGTEGASYRRRQLMRQLPIYDQDSSHCCGLAESEIKLMEDFVKKYKSDVLGVGEVALPGQGGRAKEEGKQPDKNVAASKPPISTNGALSDVPTGMEYIFQNQRIWDGSVLGDLLWGSKQTRLLLNMMNSLDGPLLGQNQCPQTDIEGYSEVSSVQMFCDNCKQAVATDCPVVYVDRAGYDRQWHPGCFVCFKCSEPLVDLIYFWKNGAVWCGRHYCESIRPRCAACDEIIFSEDYQQAEGLTWHKKHFTCLVCETLLTGKSFSLDKAKLLCTTCSKTKQP